MTTNITAVPTPTPPLLEVEGTFEMEDYLTQQVHLWERRNAKRERWLKRWCILAMAVLLTVVIAGFFAHLLTAFLAGHPFTGERAWAVGTLLAFAGAISWFTQILWVGTSYKQLRRRYRQYARRKARIQIWLGQLRLGCRCRFSLSPEEFIDVIEYDQKSGVGLESRYEFRIRWDRIQGVDVTEGYLFLWLHKKRPVPIPRRWFPDQASFDDYGRTAWEYWVGATRPPDTGFPGDSQAIRRGAEG